MLRSCSYCGRIHDSKYNCGKKPARHKIRNREDAFRSTAIWQQKAEEIKVRDNYLCQVCRRNLYGTVRRLNAENLSVHHAVSLRDDYEKRLDNDNLLTVCSMHHGMAEGGKIPFGVIDDIICEQESIPRDNGAGN